MKKIYLPLIYLVIALLFAGCGSIANFINTSVSNMMTKKISDFSEAGIYIKFIRNCYPKESDTDEVRMIKDEWQNGGNLVLVQIYKMRGFGWYEVDGTVKIDGAPVPHLLQGTYAKRVNDLSEKEVEIVTANGKSYKFTVKPAEAVAIENVSNNIDKNSDLHLSLTGAEDNSKVRLSFLYSPSITQNAWGELITVKSNNKLTIPKEAYNHAITNYFKNDTWLLVEKFKMEKIKSSGFLEARLISAAYDYKEVSLSGSCDYIEYGYVYETKTDPENANYFFMKPNAIGGRPFAAGKKFAVISFTVRATKLSQQRDWTRYYTRQYQTQDYEKTTYITEKWKEEGTTLRTFPHLPEYFWDNLLQNSYTSFISSLQSQYPHIEIIPIEEVKNAASYASLNIIEDTLSKTEYLKTYDGLRDFAAENNDQIFDRFGPLQNKLIEELGVDGLIIASFNLEMPFEEYSLNPKFNISIVGGGFDERYALASSYLWGSVWGKGLPIENFIQEDGTINEDVLEKVTMKEEIFKTLTEGFMKIKDDEEKLGYNKIWKLKI